MALILVPWAAFLWRIRGGLVNNITGKANFLGLNDTAVRLIWSIGISAAYGALSAWTWHIAALTAGLFAGTTIIGWFGAALYPVKWADIGLLSLSGTLRMAFVAVALFSPWPLVAGLLCGPIYWLGGKIPQPWPWGFWQEWFFGSTIGASLVAVIWWPHGI